LTTCVGLRYGHAYSLFLEVDSPDYHFGRSLRVLSHAFTWFNALFRQCAPGTPLRRFYYMRGTGILTCFPPALSLLMPTFAFPKAPVHIAMHIHRRWNAPLPYTPKCTSYASVLHLMPVYYRRPAARPVSCYALFKGIAASKLTSWLSRQLDHLCST